MVVFGVHVVERSGCLLQVVMTTLQEITSSSIGVRMVVGVVSRIDVIPVYLRRFVVARFPEIYEMVVLLLIDRRTDEVSVVSFKSVRCSKRIAVHILADEQTPRIVVAFLVEELSRRSGLVRVRDLTVPHSGRQVAVVVRTRIRSVVEVEGRVGVERVVVSGCYFDLLRVIYLELKSGDEGRVIGLDDAAVTHFTVLVAPIGVIVVRTGKVVHLLRHSSILTTLCGSTKSDQFEACSIPDLLCGNEVTERVVLDTFSDDTFVVDIRREAVRELCYYGPSVLHDAGSVRRVQTHFVVTVRTCSSDFPTLCITACSHEVVGRLTDTTKGEVGSLHGVEYLFVAACIVQTSHSGVVEVTAFLRVKGQTLDVVVLNVRLITTIAVTRCGPSE